MENNCSINPQCFFCQKNFDNDSSVNVFNLRQLFRYLKIILKLDQNSVLLCTDCYQLGCQLYKQIVELEVTQIKITHSLEQIVTKISSVSSSETDVLQKLVKEKCISQLRKTKLPKVKLNRLAKVCIMMPVPEDPVMFPISFSPPPAQLYPILPQPEETIVKIEVDDDLNNMPTTISIPKPKILHKSRKSSENPKTCQFCAKILRNSKDCHYHEAEDHPDKLLLEAKLDHITDFQFLQICQDVLSKHNVIQSPMYNNSTRYGCVYCQNLYGKLKCLKYHMIQCHLPTLIKYLRQVQKNPAQYLTTEQGNHNNKIDGTSQLGNEKHAQVKPQNLTEDNIVTHAAEDQQMSPIPSSPSSPPPLSPEPEETIVKMEIDSKTLSTSIKKRMHTPRIPNACRFCPKVYGNHAGRQHHETQHHPDKLLLKGKLDNTSDPQFLEICQDVLTRHKIVKNQHNCLYCENSCTKMRALKLHMVKSHLPNLLEKVRQLQQIVSQKMTTDKELACQYCNIVFKNVNGLKIHKSISCEILGQLVVLKSVEVPKREYPKFKLHLTILPGQDFPCQFCPKTFQSKAALQIHSHIEHYLNYLNKAKLENVSEEHFELYCTDLFEQHSPVKQKEGSRRNCIYCKSSFSQSRNYKSHLMDKHIEILYDKLNVMQKEPPKIQIYNDESGKQVCKRVCKNCGKWVKRNRLGTHAKYECKSRKNNIFFERCRKCSKRFYSLAELNEHSCPAQKTKTVPCPRYKKHKLPVSKRRVQCDKCGIQLNLYRLRVHQLEFCGRVKKRLPKYRKLSFVRQNMIDILTKMKTQMSGSNLALTAEKKE